MSNSLWIVRVIPGFTICALINCLTSGPSIPAPTFHHSGNRLMNDPTWPWVSLPSTEFKGIRAPPLTAQNFVVL